MRTGSGSTGAPLRRFRGISTARLNAIIAKIYDIAGETFNINSPQQLVRILFHRLNLPPVKKTKTSLSTDNEVLQTLSDLHPLPAEILEYRMLTKLKSTYVDSLHTLIHQRPAGSTRPSTRWSSRPVGCRATIPICRTSQSRVWRAGRSGRPSSRMTVFFFVSSDYSQIELRVLAHISGDELLIDAFRNDQDIHSRVAQEVFGVDADHVTARCDGRPRSSTSASSTASAGTGSRRSSASARGRPRHYIEAYFERHTGIKDYIEKTVAEAREKGFVRTLFGRIRYIPELSNADINVRQFGERTAMNTPIQGTAADIIKMAMVNIHRKLGEERSRTRLIMQIHDELVFEVPEPEVSEMEGLIRHEMEHVCPASPAQGDVGRDVIGRSVRYRTDGCAYGLPPDDRIPRRVVFPRLSGSRKAMFTAHPRSFDTQRVPGDAGKDSRR